MLQMRKPQDGVDEVYDESREINSIPGVFEVVGGIVSDLNQLYVKEESLGKEAADIAD